MNFLIDTIVKVTVLEVCFCLGAIIINPVVRNLVALIANQ